VTIPPTNLKPEYLEQSRAFATGLADRLGQAGQAGQTGVALPSEAQNGQPTDTTKASTHE
jgi:hypothetical protein